MQCKALSVPKRGNTAEEYEDAFAVDSDLGRFALADGATGGYFAAPWAQMLVEDFAHTPEAEPGAWLLRVPALQQQWCSQLIDRPLPWYAKEKLAEGAFATFLGVVLKKTPRGRYTWTAVAVGDTCLFHVRRKRLRRAFPMSRPDEFGTTPALVGSRTPLALIEKGVARKRGRCTSGDRLWMMTDALAQWFLTQHESGYKPWEQLEAILETPGGDEGFAAWIDTLRDEKLVRNDDVTLLRVIVPCRTDL